MPQTDFVDLVLSQWTAECPGQDFSSMAVITRLFRLNAFATRNVSCGFRQHQLNQGEFDVLATLYRCGPPYAMNPQKLVAALLLTSGAMTNRLDRLEQAGLLARNPNRRPARHHRVAHGRRPAHDPRRAQDYLKNLEQLLEPLGAAERRQLAGLLKKLLINHDLEAPGGVDA